MAKRDLFNPWEGVKVGSFETFLTATPCWSILHIFFLNKYLALKFDTHVFNLEMTMSPKFHGEMTFFQPLGGCKSWQQCRTHPWNWQGLPYFLEGTVHRGRLSSPVPFKASANHRVLIDSTLGAEEKWPIHMLELLGAEVKLPRLVWFLWEYRIVVICAKLK